ncbi:hypothetical protein RZS08_08065, partial [Arthrospira platensis SPKY1]|nr:hypothetical protein [Arthrospira platensis SPKY1]
MSFICHTGHTCGGFQPVRDHMQRQRGGGVVDFAGAQHVQRFRNGQDVHLHHLGRLVLGALQGDARRQVEVADFVADAVGDVGPAQIFE